MSKPNQLGDKHFIDGIECVVKYVNAGIGWLCPTTNDDDTPLVAKHIAFAKIDSEHVITLI